ncbi:MAG: dihydroorotate dehydrogenase electron transfer subunit [Candidatus Sedimenticola sp. (ex Thyasira tokunagai)]
MSTDKSHRDTIFLEDAEILSHDAFDGEQHILRLQAPECASAAKPGSFVHVQCTPSRPLRRPISIMRVSPSSGWVELLYKAVGEGTRLLSERKQGEKISIMGPIGTPFLVHQERSRPLLIGGGVGMPPMIFLAEALADNPAYRPMAILGSEVPFPFKATTSEIPVPGITGNVSAAVPLLDGWGIPSRLASLKGFDHCHQGYVTDLARLWLDALDRESLQQVEIFSCGPHPMLEAVAALAAEYDLPCQVSLEEFMACGVGGCAGCVVEVDTPAGTAMKRVCVDGPVFDATTVFPSSAA